jgi:DNA primase
VSFDALRFFNTYGIQYWTEGPNCQEGWINITCPMPNCSDTTNHLGINSYNAYAHCWICGGHKLETIISKLLNVTYDEAIKIILEFEGRVQAVQRLNKKVPLATKVELPGEALGKKHKRYLVKRNFDPEKLEKEFHLTGTGIIGIWKFRIIIPLFYKERLVSFIGRDITGLSEIRYKNLSKEKSIIDPKECLYDLDNCKKNYVGAVEGIFDKWRMGKNWVATLGTSLTQRQIKLLSKFEKVFIMFDSEEEAQIKAKRLGSLLSSLGSKVEIIDIETGDDPANLTDEEALEINKELGFI